MDILLIIYFSINVFCAGYYLGDNLKFTSSSYETRICLIWVISRIFFAIPIYLIYFSYKFLIELDGYLQYRFWFMYFFTKKYRNLSEFEMEVINKLITRKSSKKLNDRYYVWCLNFVKSRNL